MKKPEFTLEQEEYICHVIGDWYMKWKDKLIAADGCHRLGYAKEDLKDMICESQSPVGSIKNMTTKNLIDYLVVYLNVWRDEEKAAIILNEIEERLIGENNEKSSG